MYLPIGGSVVSGGVDRSRVVTSIAVVASVVWKVVATSSVVCTIVVATKSSASVVGIDVVMTASVMLAVVVGSTVERYLSK